MPDESYFHNRFQDSQIQNFIQAYQVQIQALKPAKPSETPQPPTHWTDRAEGLAEIRHRLTGSRPRRVVISGVAGGGKTAMIAYAAAELYDHFPDGQIYIDLGADRVLTAMRSALLRLGQPKDLLSESLGGLSSHFRSATAGKKMLIVVDGVRRIREGMLFEPGDASSGLAIIGRDLPDDGDPARIDLSHLGPPHSSELLLSLCPWLNESEAAALAAKHGGHPATLMRLAGLIRARHRRGLDVSGTEPADLDAENAEQLLDATYNSLSPSTAWLYQLLGALPSARLEKSIMDVFRTPSGSNTEAFEELVNAQLINEPRPGWYEVETVVMEDAARRRAEKGLPIELLNAMRQTLRWYVRRAWQADKMVMGSRLRIGQVPTEIETDDFENSGQALTWMRDNHSALYGGVTIAALHGWHQEAFTLAESMWALYTNMPYPEEAERCYRLAATGAESPEAEARMLAFLGKTLTDLTKYEEAEETLLRARDLARSVGSTRLVGTATELLGRLRHKSGDPEGAIEWYRVSLESARSAGRARSQAWQLRFLGEAYRDLGDGDRARTEYGRALEKFKEAGDVRTAVLTEIELVLLEVDKTRPETIARAERVIGWAHELGLATHEARALRRLGMALGPNEGHPYLEAALQILDRFGDVEAERIRSQLSQ